MPSDIHAPDPAAPEPAPPRLSLRPREAAAALGIGERLLWAETNAGRIPCARIGRAVVYPVDLLREYLRQQAEGGER